MAPCNDPASQSNPEEAAATHASIVMDVDFDGKIIQGSVEYTVEIKVRAHTRIRYPYSSGNALVFHERIHSHAIKIHTRVRSHVVRILRAYIHMRIHVCAHPTVRAYTHTVLRSLPPFVHNTIRAHLIRTPLHALVRAYAHAPIVIIVDYNEGRASMDGLSTRRGVQVARTYAHTCKQSY